MSDVRQTADEILAAFPVAGDGLVMGISPGQGETLVSAGFASRRRDGGFRLTARGFRAKQALASAAGPGKIKTVGGGGTIPLAGGLAKIRGK